MKRILVIGSPGAGKSSFSRRLAELTGLELIHLDRIYWLPGWVEPEKADFDAKLARLLAGDSWIIDGNFSSTLEWRLSAADAAILMDMNRALCTYRVLKRSLFTRDGKRTDMAEGCRERLDWEFLKWTWDYPGRSRPKVLERLKRGRTGKKIFTLHSPREAERFLRLVEISGDIDTVEFGLWK